MSFQLEGGTICGLVGETGVVNQPLFKSLMGLAKPQEGETDYVIYRIQQALKRT